MIPLPVLVTRAHRFYEGTNQHHAHHEEGKGSGVRSGRHRPRRRSCLRRRLRVRRSQAVRRAVRRRRLRHHAGSHERLRRLRERRQLHPAADRRRHRPEADRVVGRDRRRSDHHVRHDPYRWFVVQPPQRLGRRPYGAALDHHGRRHHVEHQLRYRHHVGQRPDQLRSFVEPLGHGRHDAGLRPLRPRRPELRLLPQDRCTRDQPHLGTAHADLHLAHRRGDRWRADLRLRHPVGLGHRPDVASEAHRRDHPAHHHHGVRRCDRPQHWCRVRPDAGERRLEPRRPG